MLKDPGILALRDDDQEPEAGYAPAMGGTSTYPAGPFNPGAPKPDAPPPQDDSAAALPKVDPLQVTAQDLKDAAAAKRRAAILGAITDNLGSRQSFGNFFLGRMNPQSTAGAQMAKTMGELADQPVQQKLALQKQAIAQPQLDYQRAIQDPNSMPSKLTKSVAISAISALPNKDQYSDLISMINDPKASGAQVHLAIDNDPVLKEAFSSSIAGQKLAAMMAAAAPKNAYYQQKTGQMADDQANKAASDVDKDPLLKQYSGQVGQIGKAMGILNSPGALTHQTASELAQDMGTILANGRAAGLEQSNKQEYSSAQGALAQAQQWLTGHPQDALPEELRQNLREQFQRLNGAVNQQMSVRATQLKVGRGYRNNPSAQQALDAKVQSYQAPAQQAPQSGLDPDDQQALQWAKSNPGNPKAVQILMHLKGKLQGGA